MRSFHKSLLQLVQFLAQLGKRLFCWIGFLTCLLGRVEIGFHHSIFLIPMSVLGSVSGMHTPMSLAKFAGLLETEFLGNLLCCSSTGPLVSGLALLRSFLAGLQMGFLWGTHALDSLERSLKRMHVHGSRPLFLQVVLILPLVWTHPENVTCQISLGERNICQCHAGIVAQALVPGGQLRDIGIELLYALYKLMYAKPLGLLEHVEKVILFLFSCVVWKHSEKVKHNAVLE
jgi:hypothetical protein